MIRLKVNGYRYDCYLYGNGLEYYYPARSWAAGCPDLRAWRKNNQPERWVDTLIATAEHDDVYNEFDNQELIGDNGGPVNFKTKSFEKEYAQRLIAMAETKSAYVALLFSKHIRFVYGTDPKTEFPDQSDAPE